MKNLALLSFVGMALVVSASSPSFASSLDSAPLTSKQVLALAQKIKTGYQAMTVSSTDYVGQLVDGSCKLVSFAELACAFKYETAQLTNVLTVHVSYLDGIAGEKLYSLEMTTAERLTR
ncbi:MAG: hypothetical protein H7222_08320 [Methylotenera sp.]|nr:hypothetical protein [Oligoflexia bacterium]